MFHKHRTSVHETLHGFEHDFLSVRQQFWIRVVPCTSSYAPMEAGSQAMVRKSRDSGERCTLDHRRTDGQIAYRGLKRQCEGSGADADHALACDQTRKTDYSVIWRHQQRTWHRRYVDTSVSGSEATCGCLEFLCNYMSKYRPTQWRIAALLRGCEKERCLLTEVGVIRRHCIDNTHMAPSMTGTCVRGAIGIDD